MSFFNTQVLEIHEITILNNSFAPIKKLYLKEDLIAFNNHWDTKGKLEVTPVDATFSAKEEHYKFDIVYSIKSSKSEQTRWLYHPDGKVVVLSKQLSPFYQIKDVANFNKLIGVN
ncbi:MAG: hypothetical protein HOO06_02685 [Bdellovibrionaceae bacterium]|nr:hypothetical protein [Pseudobdellovibrionaceae bacterium]